ncbi:1-aminocyclopropane-1-carboxylate deaminase [Lentzea sp. NBRC 105346]|nr:1-aminocyclopropane-1-carboxylate deaminase [Lentzea sp. NBRC 105346]
MTLSVTGAMTELRTFRLPELVTGSDSDIELGRRLIAAWQADGILQIATDAVQDRKTEAAMAASREFFHGLSLEEKAKLVSDLTYAGYIASGEEVTDGVADFSEIFTVCKDVPLDDSRVQDKWPCHGPVPWPSESYRVAMNDFMGLLGEAGEKILQLTALGFGLEIDAFTRLTVDGWHHMRVLRFPEVKEDSDRGIGAHTDYGMLVLAAQDDVGGLYVRPPIDGEVRPRNWLPDESAAGCFQDSEGWNFVQPVPNVLTVFPGDILQFLTDGALLSTPHKVLLNTRERFTMAYFHEPNFEAVVRPIDNPAGDDVIHYGTHFTNMFMRCYPDRVTTQRILAEDRLSILDELRTGVRHS